MVQRPASKSARDRVLAGRGLCDGPALLLVILAWLAGCGGEAPPAARIGWTPQRLVLEAGGGTDLRLHVVPLVAAQDLAGDPVLALQLVGPSGEPVRGFGPLPVAPWRSGEPVAVDFAVSDPAPASRLAPGRYRLRVDLLDGAGRSLPWESARTDASTDAVEVVVSAAADLRDGARSSEAAAGDPAAARRHDVILISIDTLRADHLGCYGHERDTSPEIDRFRRDAVLFEQAIAQAPSTLLSHASIFSSLWPSHHGASFKDRKALPEAIVTLTEVLREHGYRTASFNGGGQLAPEFGLTQGFDVYEALNHTKKVAEVASRALPWIESSSERPFFLFLHSYEVHHPYTPDPESLELFADGYRGSLPPEISKELLVKINRGEIAIDDRDLAYVTAAYDAEIHSMDAALGQFFQELEDRGLYDDAIIVLTSDHGEEFGEHGTVGWHSHTLYDELLRVPLLIKLPRAHGAGRSVKAQVRSIDVAPTLLAALSLPPRQEFAGFDLMPLIEDGGFDPGLPAISQETSDAETEQSSLRSARWKLYPARLRQAEDQPVGPLRSLKRRLAGRRPDRLFDLRADPGELTDLGGREKETRRRLRALRRNLTESRTAPQAESMTPDEETLEQLRALGYVD